MSRFIRISTKIRIPCASAEDTAQADEQAKAKNKQCAKLSWRGEGHFFGQFSMDLAVFRSERSKVACSLIRCVWGQMSTMEPLIKWKSKALSKPALL